MRRTLMLWSAVLMACGASPVAAQTVRGRVTDRLTGAGVAGGRVLLLSEQQLAAAQAATGDSGRFVLVAPGPGGYRIEVQQPGYKLLITPRLDLHANESIDYDLQLTPLPAVALDTAVIEGRAVPRYLAGFYRRRAQGFGQFVTREEFERFYPHVVSDILRRSSLFDIVANPNRGRNGDQRHYAIQSRRGVGYPFGPVAGECPPLLFFDGSMMGNVRDVDVDDVLAVGSIAAMEFYDGVQVPAPFQANGSNCGVIAIWSRMEGDDVAQDVHRIALGGQVGGQWTGGALAYGRAGFQVSLDLVGPVELYPTVNFLVASWNGSGPQRAGWQLLLALRGRPLGHDSPWYVGGGLSMVDEQDRGSAFASAQQEEHLALLTGLRLPLPVVRPLIEVQVLDPLHPGRAQLLTYTGVTVRLR